MAQSDALPGAGVMKYSPDISSSSAFGGGAHMRSSQACIRSIFSLCVL